MRANFQRLNGAWLIALGALLLVANARGFNYETPFEFVSEGDFNGDGTNDVLIVDKLSGAFRIGYQNTPGDPAWADARATGIEGATSVSVGRVLATTRDTIVTTGPAANRVNLVEALTAVSPALPVSMFIPSLGPDLVAAIDIGGAGNTGHADLYVTSRENPGPRETLMRNTGASRTLITDGGLANYRGGAANAFQFKTGNPARLGLFNRNAPASDEFLLIDFGAGTASTSINFPVPLAPAPSPRFLGQRFDSGNVLAQVLFYRAGDSAFLKYQIQEPVAGTFNLGGSNSFNLGAPIQQIQIITRTTGPRLLVIFGAAATNATVARVYDFDGVNAPVLVQSFTNENGFTAAAALGFGNITLLGSDGTGRSVSFHNWLASGNGYVQGTSGELPRVTPYSGGANVIMFAGEPFVDLNAKALKSVRARDWSSVPVLAGGPPPNVTVSAEKFVNQSNGLTGPNSVALGAGPLTTTHALVNQYADPISIFTRRSAIGDEPASVTVAPPAGEYPSSIQVVFSVNTAGFLVRYRFGTVASWQIYGGPITLYSNATIQYYAAPLIGSTRTPVQSVSYTFTEPVSTLDSDNDGVPDFVEVARGLDPRGGADTDGDGFTDLEELVRNTMANAATNHPPTNVARLQTAAAFDRFVAPFGVNVAGGNAYSSNRTEMRAFNLAGDLLGSAQTTNVTVPFVRTSAAKMTNLVVPPGEKLAIEATPANFDLITGNPDKRIGRELIGLIPLPVISNIFVPYTYTGGVVSVAASNWIVSASNLHANLTRPQIVGDLVVEDALVSALFERKVSELLLARGTNSASNMTLFPFRSDDAGRESYSTDTLGTIENYVSPSVLGYNQATLLAHFNGVKTSVNAQHVALRQAAREIYRISALLHNTNAPAYGPPFAELRQLVSGQGVSADYAAQGSIPGLLANARLGASNLLATAPPRPMTNVTLEVVSISLSNSPTFQLLGTLTPVTLWRDDGRPCPLPQGFDLIPGSRISVFGHTDINPGVGGFPLEVISLSLSSIPIASDGDLNGDLLIDTWQNAFFGGGFGNAFGDDDGDGYSNIQEMFTGSDPKNFYNIPSVPVEPFQAPLLVMDLDTPGGQTVLTFQWPASYVNQFKFGVRAGSSVEGPFVDVPVGDPVGLGGNNFSLSFSLPAVQHEFYFITVALWP